MTFSNVKFLRGLLVLFLLASASCAPKIYLKTERYLHYTPSTKKFILITPENKRSENSQLANTLRNELIQRGYFVTSQISAANFILSYSSKDGAFSASNEPLSKNDNITRYYLNSAGADEVLGKNQKALFLNLKQSLKGKKYLLWQGLISIDQNYYQKHLVQIVDRLVDFIGESIDDVMPLY